MKAKQDFVIYVDSGNVPVPYKSGEDKKGIKAITVKKGKDIPKEIEEYILHTNRDFIDRSSEIPKELKDKTPPPIVRERKYSEEYLYKVYEKKGLTGLKEIGEKFNPSITDRSHRRLINEILAAQNRIRRTGK